MAGAEQAADIGGDPEPGSPSGFLRRPVWLPLILLALIGAGLVVDSGVGHVDRWQRGYATATRGELVPILAKQRRHRMVNLSLGVAARELSGDRLRELAVPRPYRKLSERPPDLFGKREVPAMQRYLLRRVVGRALKRRKYDPRVSDAEFDALIAAPGATAYPFDVWAVSVPGGDHRKLVAVSDRRRRRIAVVPRDRAPASVTK